MIFLFSIPCVITKGEGGGEKLVEAYFGFNVTRTASRNFIYFFVIIRLIVRVLFFMNGKQFSEKHSTCYLYLHDLFEIDSFGIL